MKQKRSKITMMGRLRVTLRLRYAIPIFSVVAILISFLYFNAGTPKTAKADTEVISSNSFIINMGVTPQTYNNGLRPYGMIYDLMINYQVPVKWIIEPSKTKDGTDFTYAGTAYKGGTFIIPAEYINGTVTGRITYWVSQGVIGVYTTSAINVPVYATLIKYPSIIIDDVSGKDAIITNYFNNALIPSTAYTIGTPSILTNCHDLWINPHGDPNWTTHSYLYNLVTVAKSFIWMQCHAVSVTEGVANPSSPFQKLNFLSTNSLKCYSGGKCGSATETHAGNSTAPFTHLYPTDPVMQFMGTMNGACDGGSEKWYQPMSTGAWRSTTKRLVTTATGASPNEGVLMAYGPAYGDTTNGYVMYEGGHDISGNGTIAEQVAAQRAFFNFTLLAGYKKLLTVDNVITPATAYPGEEKEVSISLKGGAEPYTYQWSSNFGATFIQSSKSSTKIKFSPSASNLSGIITCSVTDNCAQQKSISRPVTLMNTLPIKLKSFSCKHVKNDVELNWVTASETNNEYFSLERSVDGINFTVIGKVQGSKNSTIDISYSFTDDTPEEDINYYRLKQTDFDGKFTYSDIKSVRIKKNTTEGAGLKLESVYPSAFSDNFKINFSLTKSASVLFVLINVSGQIIVKENVQATAGINTYDFYNNYDLKDGVYFVALFYNDEKVIQKIIKN